MIIHDDSKQNNSEFPPEVGACYGNGMSKMSKNFLDLLLITIVVFIIGIPSWIGTTVTSWTDPFGLWGLFEFFYSLLVTGPLGFGVMYAYLKAARGEKPEINDLLKVLENYWNVLLAYIISGIIIFIGFILLIIPGIIFACKLSFVPYLVIDKKMDAVAAIQESWRLTNGYALTVFVIALLAIPISIGGFLLFGVGIILAQMWIGLSFASLYHAVISRMNPELSAISP
ncbi:MAG: hypothetical protein JSU79_08510 [Dehalococcoidales bacterium]|nr:MAG: hypothetical protein JSU79_08510 [Dehalococcoidales bacterium]